MTPEDKEFIGRLYKAFIPEASREDSGTTSANTAREILFGLDHEDRGELELLIAQAIIAAVEEEREECAKIVEDLIDDMTFCGALLTAAVAVIRARGKK